MSTYKKGERGKYQLVVSAKNWRNLKQKLKTITRKTTPMSFDERIEKLKEVQQGWINAFEWQASKTNSLNRTGGSGTVSGIVYGTTGRSLIGKGKTLSVSASGQNKPINGAVPAWGLARGSKPDSGYYYYSGTFEKAWLHSFAGSLHSG